MAIVSDTVPGLVSIVIVPGSPMDDGDGNSASDSARHRIGK